MTREITDVAPFRFANKTHLLSSPMSDTSRGEPIEILLVEDSPDDADLTIDALRDGRVRNRISHVEDGVEAMAFLRREGKYSSSPRPDLILLDWRMPRKNGQEVLSEVKSDPALKTIPVVVMTSSDEEADVMEAYKRHVNCYVTKPVDLDQFKRVVKSIESFWFTIVKLPAA
jgi:chemotaxis family two-component system response regulator Rcp1